MHLKQSLNWDWNRKPLSGDDAQKMMEDFEHLRHRLTRVARATLGSAGCEADADDCFQDAIERLLLKYKAGISILNYLSWLYESVRRLAKSKSTSYWAQAGRITSLDSDEIYHDKDIRFAVFDLYAFEDMIFTDEEIAKMAKEVIDRLKESEKDLFLHYSVQCMSHKLLEAHYGVNASALNQRIFRMNCHLRDFVKEVLEAHAEKH